jgi:alpha-tubulin suppressor-like RCC1 family protein
MVTACSPAVDNPTHAPDLVIEGIVLADSALHSGDRVQAWVIVRNTGQAPAAATRGHALWSADLDFTANDSVLAEFPVAALVPGQETGPIPLFVILPKLPLGKSYLAATVDSDPKVPEASRTNNIGVFEISAQPDLATQPPRLGVTGTPGFCAIAASSAVYCWGINTRHNFGLATTSPGSATPVASGLPALRQLAAGNGGDHLCGITASGAAMCWGRDDAGFLGNGTVGPIPIVGSPPVTVAGGITWSSISVSQLSACGVSVTGTGYCWGSNQRGEIGSAEIVVGSTSPGSGPPGTPLSVTSRPHVVDGGLAFRALYAGWLHSCGITTADAAYCWGNNSFGELGIGTIDTVVHRTPTPVAGGLRFLQLSVGAEQTCGITTTHTAYCWGRNATGQLGDGTTIDRGAPTPVAGGNRFSYVSTGSGFGDFYPDLPILQQGAIAHTCALGESGLAFCWGWNGNGQLGNGSAISSAVPMPVAGDLRFDAIATGGSATCAMKGDRLWCWGRNTDGQLGNGTKTSSAVPVLVAAPFEK